jgi:hypothetical protein
MDNTAHYLYERKRPSDSTRKGQQITTYVISIKPLHNSQILYSQINIIDNQEEPSHPLPPMFAINMVEHPTKRRNYLD